MHSILGNLLLYPVHCVLVPPPLQKKNKKNLKKQNKKTPVNSCCVHYKKNLNFVKDLLSNACRSLYTKCFLPTKLLSIDHISHSYPMNLCLLHQIRGKHALAVT